jgi:LacI family transcriptional regulator
LAAESEADSVTLIHPNNEGRAAARQRKRATLKTISEATGFALTTVSRALKNEPEISAETRSKVQAVAAELGYRPDRAARGLRTGRTFVVGLILDQTLAVAEFERRIIGGVSDVIYGETTYDLVVLPHTEGADTMDSVRYFVESAQVDGLIFAHTTPDDPRARYLLDRHVPFVTHGRTDFSDAHAWFDYDLRALGRLAVERLVEKGRKRLAIVSPTPRLTCTRYLLGGFRDAVRDLGAEGAVIPGIYLHDDPAQFREAARRLASGGNVPDGIVCSIETASVALIAGLQDAGLVVGRDIDVVANGTSDILDYITPPIDSFFEDLTLAGQTMARFLMKRINGVPAAELQTLQAPKFCPRT